MPGPFDTLEAIGVVGTFGASTVGIKTFGPFWVGMFGTFGIVTLRGGMFCIETLGTFLPTPPPD
eukprot:4038815-Ditylum_brightwellii.AAC.1